jgi:hypothetical protein
MMHHGEFTYAWAFPPPNAAHNANPAITVFLMCVSSCLGQHLGPLAPRSEFGRQTRPLCRPPKLPGSARPIRTFPLKKIPCRWQDAAISEGRRVKRSSQALICIPNACLQSADPLRLPVSFPPFSRIRFPLLSPNRGSADDEASHRQTPVHSPQRARGCALALAPFPVAQLQHHMLRAEPSR